MSHITLRKHGEEMNKKKYIEIKNNKLVYKIKYYITIILGVIFFLFLAGLSYQTKGVISILVFIIFILYTLYFIKYLSNSCYQQFLCIEKFEVIENVPTFNYENDILYRLEIMKYKVEKHSDNFYYARKNCRVYGIYIINSTINNIKINYSLSHKYKFSDITKFSFEGFNLVNIIIANQFDDKIKDLFKYNGINLYPYNEMFIGVELKKQIIYMNYSRNNKKNKFSQELYEIVTGFKK